MPSVKLCTGYLNPRSDYLIDIVRIAEGVLDARDNCLNCTNLLFVMGHFDENLKTVCEHFILFKDELVDELIVEDRNSFYSIEAS